MTSELTWRRPRLRWWARAADVAVGSRAAGPHGGVPPFGLRPSRREEAMP